MGKERKIINKKKKVSDDEDESYNIGCEGKRSYVPIPI